MTRATAAVVYRAYSANGDLLYVGVTQNFTQRMKGHRSERPWWRTEVARVEQDEPRPYRDALAAERRQIQELQPRYNQRRVFCDGFATYTIRTTVGVLAPLRAIAAAKRISLAQLLRELIKAEIAACEKREAQQSEREVIHHVCGDDRSTPADLSATEAA